MAKTKTLVDLNPGESAEVVDFVGEPSENQRLMHMGVVEGTTVQLIRAAPSGDPIEISVMDYALSLRREDAERIIVQQAAD